MANISVFCGMGILHHLIHFFKNPQGELISIVNTYGASTYAILGVIIFAETGLIITPFLPGDSLLIAAGALSARADIHLNLGVIIGVTFVAAFLGNMVNYQAGRLMGAEVLNKKIPFIKPHHIEETHAFFEKYGGWAVVLSRFMPIIRTISPFVAGVGKMGYAQFTLFNFIGGALWVTVCSVAGYLFGNIPFVQKNFEWVIVGVIVVSLIPAIYGALKTRTKKAS